MLGALKSVLPGPRFHSGKPVLSCPYSKKKKRLGTDHSWDPSHDQPSNGDRELLRAGFTFTIEIWSWGEAAGRFLEGRGPRSRRARGGAGLRAAALGTARRGLPLAVPRQGSAVAAVSKGELFSPAQWLKRIYPRRPRCGEVGVGCEKGERKRNN